MPPKYRVELSRTAEKQLDKLPTPTADRLIETIQDLSINPRPPGCKKLRARKGYRVRQGEYRIIYDIFDHVLLVDIIAVGHRKDIYD